MTGFANTSRDVAWMIESGSVTGKRKGSAKSWSIVLQGLLLQGEKWKFKKRED
jgi:hypothetical protein